MLNIHKAKSFDITINDIASDKSISHRCAIFSLLSDQTSHIKNFLQGEDTLNSLKITESLGAKVTRAGKDVTITPPISIKSPSIPLDCGNGGTGIRLYLGLLAGLKGQFILYGDESLSSRPMARVTKPLKDIGATIYGRDEANLAPLVVYGNELKSFDFVSKISSAQVKSAMILAALQSDGICTFEAPKVSRNHSENMLIGMGADIRFLETKEKEKIQISPLTKPLKPLNITVPADPSSAFFFAVAAAITPNSRVILKNILLNPTRIEAYKVLQNMGAKVEFIQKDNTYESSGDIIVSHNELQSTVVDKNIPALIDELPALAIAMAVANGVSTVKNAKELRAKESDRISSVVTSLKACGIKVKEFEDGYEITGGKLHGAEIKDYDDHRIAMSFAVAGLVSGNMKIHGEEYIKTSFPNFVEILQRIGQVYEN